MHTFTSRVSGSSWGLQMGLTQLLGASPLGDLKWPLVVTQTLRSLVGKLGDDVIFQCQVWEVQVPSQNVCLGQSVIPALAVPESHLGT